MSRYRTNNCTHIHTNGCMHHARTIPMPWLSWFTYLCWTNSTCVRLSPVSIDHLTPSHQPSNHTRLQTFAGSARITRIWQRPKRRKRSGWFCFSLVIVRVGVSALVGPASRSLSGSFRLGRRGVTVFVSPTAVTRVHFTDDWVGVRYQFTQRV